MVERKNRKKKAKGSAKQKPSEAAKEVQTKPKKEKDPNATSSDETDSEDERRARRLADSSDDEPWRHVPLAPADVQDLTGNGDLLKVLVRAGRNDLRPAVGDTALIHYVATIDETGEQFHSTRADDGAPRPLKLGDFGNVRGLDVGVRTMTQGELARFTCKPHYAYLDAGMTRAVIHFEVELFSWEYGEDLTGEGAISRSLQSAGALDSQSPTATGKVGDPVAIVSVHAIGYYDGRIFLSEDMSYELGEAEQVDLPDGVDVALRRFKVDERSLVKIRAGKWGYGEEARQTFEIPDDGDVVFDLTLTKWEQKSFNSYDSLKGKVDGALQLKEQGTRFLKSQKYRQALVKYDQVIYLLTTPEAGITGFEQKELNDKERRNQVLRERAKIMLGKAQPADEQVAASLSWGAQTDRRDGIYLAALLNACLCQLKQQTPDAEAAVRACTLALEQSPGHVKALFRRATAREYLRQWDDAAEDYAKVLNFEPHNSAARDHLRVCRNPPRRPRKPRFDDAHFGDIFEAIVSKKERVGRKPKKAKAAESAWTTARSPSRKKSQSRSRVHSSRSRSRALRV